MEKMVTMCGWLSAATTWASRLEARQTVGVSRESVGKNLQRNITIQFRVACAVDLAHPAGAEHRDDFIRAEARSGGEGHGLRRG